MAKREPLCLYCFGSGKGACSVSPWGGSHFRPLVPGLLPLPHRASGGGEPEAGLQERGREGTGWGQDGGTRLCYRLPFGWGAECKPASIVYQLLPQAAATEHLLTHLNIDPKEIPTFRSIFFFFKVQKALCCPRERIFGQAVQCKVRGGS